MTHRIDRIGKFEIIEQLGEGSLGEVFLARDTIIGREVALKIIRRTSLLTPDPEGRFMREIQAASRLNHPNLVTIHEFGEKDGFLFFAMDYLPGPDLEAMVRDHALTPKEALDLLAHVCDGLAYVHQHGVLHRNLKPANVRIGRVAGRPAPKLLDCGLSRGPGDEPTAAAALLASLACTAPECLHGGKADGRADLFAVGVMLYEALSGFRPFEGETPAAVAQRVREEEPADLDLALFPELSPSIQGVLRQALAKDPARRFPTAEAMAEALRTVQNPSWSQHKETEWVLKPGKPLQVPARPDADRPASSGARAAWISFLAAAVVLGGGAGFWWWSRHRSQRTSPPPLPVTVPSPLQPKPPEPAAAPAQPAAPAPQAPAPAAAAPQPPAPAQTRNSAGTRPQGPAAPPVQGGAGSQVPVQGQPRHGYASLEQAAGAVDSDPEGALAYLEPAVAADPDNESALAHRIVALYNLKRYGACIKAIREARDAGHLLWPMATRQPALRRMLERDSKDPHLPRKKPAPAEPAPEPAP